VSPWRFPRRPRRLDTRLLSSQGSPHDEAVGYNLLTWGEYKFQFVPAVDRFKWLETRHMVNISDRWNRDENDDLQFAFFNGVGWESWENIWGIWNGITPRDAEATRRKATIERAFAPFLSSQGWEPFYPTSSYGVFASRWPLNKTTLWTMVNRNEYDVNDTQLSVPAQDGARYFDLYHGVELVPNMTREGNWAQLSFPIESHGFGAVFQIVGEPDSSAMQFMAKMKSMTAKPLASYSKDRPTLVQRIVDIRPTAPHSSSSSEMVRIPGGDSFFVVGGIEVEGSDDEGVDVQYPWEDSPRRFHKHFMHIDAFDIDKYPATNKEFKAFLDATHYHPKDDLNFLKDWQGGAYPVGWENKPVTWVSRRMLEPMLPGPESGFPTSGNGNIHCKGPTRENTLGEIFGDPMQYLVPDQGRTMHGPDDVYAHPAGVSPTGVMDMVGNVWQWTDEYV